MKYRALILVAALAAALTGCVQNESTPPTGNKPNSNSPGNSPGNTTASTPEGAAKFKTKPESEKLRIAVVPKGTTHQFWQTVNAGAQAAGKEFNCEVVFNGPKAETDIQDQIDMVKNFATQGFDGIALAATNRDSLSPVVDKIQADGVPVVIIDSGINPDHSYSFIATDNVAAAKKAADELAKLIGDKGEVAVLPFLKGAGTSDEREQGFLEGIKTHPNIKLVANEEFKSDSSQAADKTETILTQHPNLSGIFAASEPGVIGCGGVLKRKGLAGKVKLVGFDAADAEITFLKDGIAQALVVQDPFKMGYEGVKSLAQLIRGKGTPPKRIDTGAAIVTKENMDTPDMKKLLNPLAK